MEVDVTFIKANKSLQEKKWKEARWPKLDLHKFVGNTNSKSQFFVWIICGNIRPWLPWWPSFKICNCGKYCCCVFYQKLCKSRSWFWKLTFPARLWLNQGITHSQIKLRSKQHRLHKSASGFQFWQQHRIENTITWTISCEMSSQNLSLIVL